MADFGIVEGIALAGTALSAGTAAYGAVQSSQAQAAAANYQAKVAANNATIANQQASQRAEMQEQAGDQIIGRQRAAIAAGGIDTNSGSPLSVQSDTARSTALNTATTSYLGGLQAEGFRSQSEVDTSEAQQAGTAGAISATGDVFAGASNVAAKWQNFYANPKSNTDPTALYNGSSVGSTGFTSQGPGY